MNIGTEGGLVSGLATPEGGHAFLGIPFAAPPIGALRWRPPQPPAAWTAVRRCDAFGPACAQITLPADALMKQFSFDHPPECGTSEDCLYLNVWTHAIDGARAPVIVFIYGGGHRVGSGSHPVSRGARLAAKGAVVVTFNYRVGALGYLAHPELTAESGASGNYACLDVIAALGWVRRNIATFGGDPDCITVAGQSAGAALASVLMASPGAKGLFHRAILHSGGRVGAGVKALADAEREGAQLTGGRSAAVLRALPPAELLFAAPPGFWGPIIDGHVLEASVDKVFERGEQSDVPLLAGYTRNEGTPYPTPELHSREAFVAHAHRTWGSEVESFLRIFPARDDAEAIRSSYALRRDSYFAFQPWKVARLHTRTASSPVFLFNFMRAVPLPDGTRFREPLPPGGYGAYHGAELWYAFDTLSAKAWPWTAADRSIAATLSSAWVAFARTGTLPDWPEFRATGLAMHLDEHPHAAPPFNGEALEFLDTNLA